MSLQDDLDDLRNQLSERPPMVGYGDKPGLTVPSLDMNNNLETVVVGGNVAVDAAQISLNAGEDAYTSMQSAEQSATTASNAAVVAVDAKNTAVAAEIVVTDAKNEAVQANDDAQAAKNTTISARDEVVAARDVLVPAIEETLEARDVAVDASDSATNAANVATTKADEASQSAAEAEYWAGQSGEVTSVQGKKGVVVLEASDFPWIKDIELSYIPIESRGDLRNIIPDDGAPKIIEGLGLFIYRNGAQDIDDDLTCFATESGRWLMQAESPEFAIARTEIRFDALEVRQGALEVRLDKLEERVLFGSGASGITSVSSASQASFTIAVKGARVGEVALISPPNNLSPRISIYAVVTSDDLVTVYINNPGSSGSGTLSGTAIWRAAVITE